MLIWPQASAAASALLLQDSLLESSVMDKIFVGMILILIFGEALALYGLIVSLILTSS
jgi:F0F1-type ATP synthase membrane subunit c/vacuolar-type H+-ATPase subunit K